jgi:hypothetical protein
VKFLPIFAIQNEGFQVKNIHKIGVIQITVLSYF